MADKFTETFLFTALPDSVNGTKIRIAVLVSPRVSRTESTEQAPLSNWPDVERWPAITPQWTVTLKRGATTVTKPATEVSGPYDYATWQQLFPAGQPTTPYQAEDRHGTPIYSYPVSKVLETVKELHRRVLTEARTDFPALTALRRMTAFSALKNAASPYRAFAVGASQGRGPIPDTERSAADAFAMADIFHGVRPGSQSAPVNKPVINSISPVGGPPGRTPVKITGTNLGDDDVITFGGLIATIVDNTKTPLELTCMTPGGLVGTTVDVRVWCGDEPSNAKPFNYISAPK